MSKTVRRPRNQCRIVITVEVELSEEQMSSAPRHLIDAVDILREADRHAQVALSEDLADAFGPLGIKVLSHKTEILK